MALLAWVTEIDPEVVAVDAPQGPSLGLLARPVEGAKTYARQVCDREIRKRGMPLCEVIRRVEHNAGWELLRTSSWMRTGQRRRPLWLEGTGSPAAPTPPTRAGP